MRYLFVINPQNSFLSADGAVYMGDKSEILKIRMADYIRGFKGKKIFFREKHGKEDSFFSCDKTHSIVNTPDFEIEPSLKGLANTFIDKTRYSALYNTGMVDYLKKDSVNEVYIVGIETHTSVLFTAEDLRNIGCKVFIIEPCCMSRDDYMHSAAISIMVNFLDVKVVNE